MYAIIAIILSCDRKTLRGDGSYYYNIAMDMCDITLIPICVHITINPRCFDSLKQRHFDSRVKCRLSDDSNAFASVQELNRLGCIYTERKDTALLRKISHGNIRVCKDV